MVNAAICRFVVTHIPYTRSSKVVQVLEELHLPYTVKPKGAGAKVPILEVFEGDVEEPAFTVFESGAITQFLLETFGNKDIIWVPDKEDLAAYANYLKWFWFSECELAEPLAQFYRHDSAFPEHMRLPQVAEYSKKRVQDALQRVEAELGKHAYIAGAEFSGADIMLAGSLNGIMALRMVDRQDFPNAAAYLKNIAQRPAFQKAFPRRSST